MVREEIRGEYGQDNHLESDLQRYVEYLQDCEGRPATPDSVDYEEFLGFLDAEHLLGLKGKDTWSADGNESQLMIRCAIARVLWDRTPTKMPEVYRRFVRQLTTSDCVLTFNYDTVLERALDIEGVPYRLFPHRYSAIGATVNVVDDTKEELVLLKMHGSVNWYDRSSYDEHVATAAIAPLPYVPRNPVFGPHPSVSSVPLVDGPRRADDPLTRVFRVPDPSPLYRIRSWDCCPLLLAPSSTKLFYARPLAEFWWGLQRSGAWLLSLAIVGYSLPPHDAYARQALYHMVRNYTGVVPSLEVGGRKKRPIRILDCRTGKDAVEELRTRYRFINFEAVEMRLDGFNPTTAEWILS